MIGMSDMHEKQVVIIGASHAGAAAIHELRQSGWQGRITLIGDEPQLPYQRPPLSKALLSGEKTADELLIRPAAYYQGQGVETRLGRKVTKIDRVARQVRLGETALHYDKLILATGARARSLPVAGHDLGGVHLLRDLADVARLQADLPKAKRAVIIGGGYIGLETAASLRKLGLEVVIIEAMERVLQRVTAPETSSFYSRIHREEGIEILTRTGVAKLSGDTRVRAVLCADGREIPADLVVVGIGVTPATELAVAAGLEVQDGVLVDHQALSSDPDIYAIGDCARHFSALYQYSHRLESVQNAMDQARAAAASICGKPAPAVALPWFWSDQFDVKLQIAGLQQGYDQVVLRGQADQGRSFAAFYLRQGRLLAVDAVNRPKEFMAAKRVIPMGISPDPNALADETIDIREALDSRAMEGKVDG